MLRPAEKKKDLCLELSTGFVFFTAGESVAGFFTESIFFGAETIVSVFGVSFSTVLLSGMVVNSLLTGFFATMLFSFLISTGLFDFCSSGTGELFLGLGLRSFLETGPGLSTILLTSCCCPFSFTLLPDSFEFSSEVSTLLLLRFLLTLSLSIRSVISFI